jgi:hypothetical protein
VRLEEALRDERSGIYGADRLPDLVDPVHDRIVHHPLLLAFTAEVIRPAVRRCELAKEQGERLERTQEWGLVLNLVCEDGVVDPRPE